MTRMFAGALLGLTLALGGCGNTGYFLKSNATEVELKSNNYQVIMTGVSGSDTGFRFLGIGSRGQYATALQKIRVQAQLEDRPRALINVTEDYNWYNVGIAAGETITLTADVIEFTGGD